MEPSLMKLCKKRESQIRFPIPNTLSCILICMHAETPLQGTGGHLLAFSKALIKGMVQHTGGMEKQWEKNNNS